MPDTNNQPQNRVAIYIRVSTIHQIDKDSIPMQRADLLSYAKVVLNTDNCVIFEDAGYSGKNTDRPNFQKMMTQIRIGAFTHVLVWKIDRISRNLLDFAKMYSELKELGVVFVSKNEQFDTSTAMGEAMLKIILVFAELERNMTSERVTATMISRASSGCWNGGRVPFGYFYNSETKQFSINEEEAKLVQFIHDEYEKCHSLVREAKILNNHGFRTRSGNMWNPVSVYIILHSIFYCGDYRYNVLKEGNRQKMKAESEWVTSKNHHPAIISREQKDRIIAILTSNRRLRKKYYDKRSKHVHIFSGLLVCDECGKTMGASLASPKRDWQYSKYSCPSLRTNNNCKSKSVSDPIVGEFVINYILNMMNAKKAFPFIRTPLDLQKVLLSGSTFQEVSNIAEESLDEFYYMLSASKAKQDFFRKTKAIVKGKSVSKINLLLRERNKTERALERLLNLYLYDEAAIPEIEFIRQRSKLEEQLDDIKAQLHFAKSEEPRFSIDDEELMRKASEFILTQKLSDRNYVSYKRLAMSVEPEVLRAFIYGIVDSITIRAGRIQQIVFRNGLAHTFVYK